MGKGSSVGSFASSQAVRNAVQPPQGGAPQTMGGKGSAVSQAVQQAPQNAAAPQATGGETNYGFQSAPVQQSAPQSVGGKGSRGFIGNLVNEIQSRQRPYQPPQFQQPQFPQYQRPQFLPFQQQYSQFQPPQQYNPYVNQNMFSGLGALQQYQQPYNLSNSVYFNPGLMQQPYFFNKGGEVK